MIGVTRTLAGVGAVLLLSPMAVGAQTIGTFSWQQSPYCNVVRLTVVQSGSTYLLDGVDDQCGAARRASMSGVAFPNPDGSIGFGLTAVTNDGAGLGGAPLHIDVTITLATVSGTWRDNTGQSGNWTFLTGAPAAGPPRPAPVPAFSSGLAAGGGRVTGVGAPVAGGDATNKTYVDAADSLLSASLFRQLVLSGYLNSTGTKDSAGPFTSSRSSAGIYSVTYGVTGLGIPADFAPPVIVASASAFCAGFSATADWSSTTSLGGFLTSFVVQISTSNAAGAAADCPSSFLLTFQPQSSLPSQSDQPSSGAERNQSAGAVQCWNTPTGAVCR
jgi:hypothetical protein